MIYSAKRRRRVVLIGGISHETNVFCREPTGVREFAERMLVEGAVMQVALAGTNTEVAGFLEAASAHDWELRPTVAAAAMPSGKVTNEAFERFAGSICVGAAAAPRPDGVLLFLHGAMVTESHEDGEAELLERLRAILGPEVPIAVVLDLHGNVTDRMAAAASILISYRTYPHIDMAERGREAGDLLERAMTGAVRPVTAVARAPMIDGCNDGRTQDGPMVVLLARARGYEASEPGVLSVSINGGFPDSDIPEAGPSVTVTGDGPSPRWREIADSLIEEAWERRDEKTVVYLTPAEAVRRALAEVPGPGPVVIADYADNPGAGAYGDATNLLRAMLDVGPADAAFGCLCDPEAVAELTRAGLGAGVTLPIGGRFEPSMGGGPLTVTGAVAHLSDGRYVHEGPMFTGTPGNLGRTATLRVGGIDILLISLNAQVLDEAILKAGGIDPRSRTLIGLKSMHHFRGAFAPIARAIYVCDSGALASPDYRTRPFRRIRRPVYPLDPVEACLASWRR